MRRRTWIDHRQAYEPRFWPLLLVAVLIVTVFTYFVDMNWWQAILVGVGAGTLPVRIRIVIWRRMHPVLTYDEYVAMKKEAAKWN